MTTVAYDGVLVAADTQMTSGGTKYPGSKHWKVHLPDLGDALVFGCGDLVRLHRAIEELRSGETPQEGEYGLLVLSPGVPPRHYQGDGQEALELPCAPFAMGSGSHAALGAMLAGKTATEAVLIACQVDLYSGPPVETYNTETSRWLKPRK